MKTWFLIPAVALCYNLRNTTDDNPERTYQLRSSIDVNWQNSEDFGEIFEAEIERLLCNDILADLANEETCSLVDSGSTLIPRSFVKSFRSRQSNW